MTDNQPQPTTTAAPAGATPIAGNAPQPIDPAILAKKLAEIKAQQNFPLAIAAGSAAAAAGAIAWAVVTVSTKSELGLMSVIIGYLVGKAIKKTGQGIDQKFGILGAVLAGIGAVAGNILSGLVFYGQAYNIPLPQLAGQVNAQVLHLVFTNIFGAMDMLFYAIAIYEGYVLSFKYRVRKPAPKPAK